MMAPLSVDEAHYRKFNRFVMILLGEYSRRKIIFQDGRSLRQYSSIEIRSSS